ncbi:MAG: hypothetical protein WKG07_14485 [Hymenobacter sp.]
MQAGTFADAQVARTALARILTVDSALAAEVVTVAAEGQTHYNVIISQFDSWLAAETVRRHLQLWGVVGQVLPPAPAPSASVAAGPAPAATRQ